MKTRVLARAKINLSLHVVGPPAGGYHPLRSVMQSIDLSDELDMTLASSNRVQIKWVGPSGGDLPERPDLVERALELYVQRSGRFEGAHVELTKRIPIGAGLGGGSADAAAALLGMAQLLGVDGRSPSITEIASQLGADVAFMLEGGCALAEGIGDLLESLEGLQHWWVIVIPSRPLSTADVYGRFDELGMDGVDATDEVRSALDEKDLERLGVLLSNDLEAAAFDLYPELALLKDQVMDSDALGAVMCGSGSSIGGLFGSQADAISAGSDLEARGLRVLVTGTATRGAEVLEQ